MSTSILSVSLANVALETLLFGIFLTLVFISSSLQVLLLRDSSGPSVSPKLRGLLGLPLAALVRRPLFLASLGLMVTVSGHWVCTIIRLFEASAFFEKESALASAYYLDITRSPYVVKTAFLILSGFLCDGTIIYRLFLIWGSSYRIILFPTLCLVALAASGISAIYRFANASPGATPYEVVPLSCSIVEFFSTLLTHIYSTGMIAWRIWSAHRDSQHFSESSISTSHINLKTSLAIFVESGILYSSWSIFLGVTYGTRPDLFTLVVDNMAVMAGISFILINLRAGLQQLGGDVKNALTCACVAIGSGEPERRVSIVYPTHLPVVHSSEPRDGDGSALPSADWRVPGLQVRKIR